MTFDDVFDRLMGHEGGYVNNPTDPGGETQWGISKRAYPELDIKALTREDAKAIYKTDFWDRLPETSDAVKFQLFDLAVNSGMARAVTMFNTIPHESDHQMIMDLLAARLDFMTKLSNWPTFGKGWARRIAQNLRYGVKDA